MSSSNPDLEFALQEECIKRKKLPSKALTTQLEVVPMMVILRDDDGNNFSILASM